MKEGRKAAAPRPWASAARHHSVGKERRGEERIKDSLPFSQILPKIQKFPILPERAPSWGWVARAADIPREPRPPNSGLPAPAV